MINSLLLVVSFALFILPTSQAFLFSSSQSLFGRCAFQGSLNNVFTKRQYIPIYSLFNCDIANNSFRLQVSSVDETIPSDDLEVWIRFSPLVGGPPILPLHSEIILKQETNGETIFHRFDFLPRDPTDPNTISQLLSFSSVPGEVRYRVCKDDDIIQTSQPIDKATSISPLTQKLLLSSSVKVKSFSSSKIENISNTSNQIDIAKTFCEEYKSTNSDLHLLKNNCYNFAWALINRIDN